MKPTRDYHNIHRLAVEVVEHMDLEDLMEYAIERLKHFYMHEDKEGKYYVDWEYYFAGSE